MAIRVKEKTIDEIKRKTGEMSTALNKIIYLESALKESLGYDVKRHILENLSELYEDRKLFDKAGKAMVNKALIDISFKEKMESYLKAGEFYAKAGKIEDAEHIFNKAISEAPDEVRKNKVRLAMKNIFMAIAKEFENSKKKLNASLFYEKLIKMPLDEIEKKEIKDKLKSTYKSLGKFKESELLEGI